MVVELAQEKVRSLQLSGAALDQRATQAAAFLLAAAALAGSLLAVETAGSQTKLFAAMSCAFFVIGAACAFSGVRSGKQNVPGIEASWWWAATKLEKFEIADARSWAAGYFEDAVAFNIKEDRNRSKGLNASLWFGLIGGGFVTLAAFSRLWN
jgi:hypothetical protein